MLAIVVITFEIGPMSGDRSLRCCILTVVRPITSASRVKHCRVKVVGQVVTTAQTAHFQICKSLFCATEKVFQMGRDVSDIREQVHVCDTSGFGAYYRSNNPQLYSQLYI